MSCVSGYNYTYDQRKAIKDLLSTYIDLLSDRKACGESIDIDWMIALLESDLDAILEYEYAIHVVINSIANDVNLVNEIINPIEELSERIVNTLNKVDWGKINDSLTEILARRENEE